MAIVRCQDGRLDGRQLLIQLLTDDSLLTRGWESAAADGHALAAADGHALAAGETKWLGDI